MTDYRKTAIVAVVLSLFSFCLGSGRAWAQIVTGSISGTVTDSTGAVISGAELTLTNTQTGVSQSVISGSAGVYVFEAVNPGTYNLTAEAKAFKRFVVTDIRAHTQDNLTIEVRLTVGSTDTQVTVTAAAPLMQAEDASVGQTVEEQQVNDLPLVARDWTTLGMLAAGTTTGLGTNNADFSVMGENFIQNDIRLDGIDDNEEIYGGGSIMGPGGTNTVASILPPPDAIQEFKLQTGNFSAEFGHSTGGIINATLKSGTNHWNGDLWEYVRNTVFNANDYFANEAGIPRPPYHQNQFGGTVGGPVYFPHLYNGRDRTFFFFDYQGTRIVTPSSSTSSVPTLLENKSGFTDFQDLFSYVGGTKTDALGRMFPLATFFDPATTRLVPANAVDPVSGLPNTSSSAVYVRDPFYTNGSIAGITDFTAQTQYLNVLPSGRLDPNAVKILSLYPNPTPGITTFPNYFQVASSSNDINQYDARIDENISDKDILWGVFDRDDETLYNPPPLPGIAEGQLWGDGSNQGPRYAITLSYTHVFTPTLTNEAHAGWNHSICRVAGPNSNTLGTPDQYGIQGVPQTVGNGGLPPISIGNLAGVGVGGWLPTLETVTALEIMDNVTKVYGAHTLKTGYQIDNLHAPIIQPPYSRGIFYLSGQYSDVPNQNTGYAGPADMLLVPQAATVPGGISNLGGLTSFSYSNYAETSDQRYYMGAYFQDDWKATHRLTLNLGLRWDHYTPYQEIHGRQADFVENGGGAGASGTYYIPQKGCASVKTSQSFQALLTSYNIGMVCSPNNALGVSQNLNFAPRIGFAYRATSQVVIRGGYGITYGALGNIGFGPNLGNSYPFLYAVSFSAANSQTPLTVPGGQTAVLENALVAENLQNPANVNGVGLTLQGREWLLATPYQETTNLTLEDQFTKNDAVSIAYVGTFGHHLDDDSALNAPSAIMPPGANMYDTSVPGHIPFPDFAPNSNLQTAKSSSAYSSMQLIYQRAMSAGLSVNANYTFSKCMTNEREFESGQGQGQNLPSYRAEWLPGFGIQPEWTLCGFDTAQVIHASGTYDLPFGRQGQFLNNAGSAVNAFVGGWITNFIFTHQTGQPFAIGCPIPTTADFGCFANVAPGKNVYAGPHNVNQWLNPQAFVNPPIATQIGQTNAAPLGGAPNQVRGPGLRDLDMSLFKEIPLHESTKLEFRAEAFDLPNWTSFANPSANLNFLNPVGFSQITSSRNNPRILQLALKLFY
jgi:hypothetical protein